MLRSWCSYVIYTQKRLQLSRTLAFSFHDGLPLFGATFEFRLYLIHYRFKVMFFLERKQLLIVIIFLFLFELSKNMLNLTRNIYWGLENSTVI